MFSLVNLNTIRHYQEDVEFTVLEEVKETWITFLNDFCRLVSYEWNEYLKNVVHKESATFMGNLTISDEAFTEWTIICKYEETVAEADEIKRIGMENWLVKRKKRNEGHMIVDKKWILTPKFINALCCIEKTR
jgi:hypothetical protein